jgi:hypothetical protein
VQEIAVFDVPMQYDHRCNLFYFICEIVSPFGVERQVVYIKPEKDEIKMRFVVEGLRLQDVKS